MCSICEPVIFLYYSLEVSKNTSKNVETTFSVVIKIHIFILLLHVLDFPLRISAAT